MATESTSLRCPYSNGAGQKHRLYPKNVHQDTDAYDGTHSSSRVGHALGGSDGGYLLRVTTLPNAAVYEAEGFAVGRVQERGGASSPGDWQNAVEERRN